MEPSRLLRSGELARLAGISPDTLRHYERIGVLPRPRRSEGNYRLYPPSSLERVRIVRQALAMGFSLAELAKVLRVREQGGLPCRQVKLLLEGKLSRVEADIANLRILRKQLQGLLKDWQKRLEETPPGHPARLLETLPALPTKGIRNENITGNRSGRRNGWPRANDR